MIGGMTIYRHLRRDNSQTRLVRVLQTSPHDIHLSLELRHEFIEDGTYSALSYAWGDASEEEYILVNRVLFRIRKNLYQALLQLRDNGIRDWLWIDTLCIQQKNVDEKSYQIGLMGIIFSNAFSCVLVARTGHIKCRYRDGFLCSHRIISRTDWTRSR